MKTVGKTQLARIIPLLIRGVAPTAAVTFGLAPATTLGAPGDLDPGFGVVGRTGPIVDFSGAAWSAQPLSGGGTLIAGGVLVEDCHDFSCYYSKPVLQASSFLGHLSDSGLVDPTFVPAVLDSTEVLDTALLPDGSIIAVGLKLTSNHPSNHPVLAVFKLSSAGALDTSFGDHGVFQLGMDHGVIHKGTSVTVDADGRIVIAGPQQQPEALIVVRLQANGALDTTFGTDGIFTHATGDFDDSGINIIGIGTGYRVTTSDCKLIALTASGQLDTSFGTAGIVSFPGDPLSCAALVAQPDGKLLAAGGSTTPHSFAVRLLPDGAIDPTFSSGSIEAALGAATALAVAQDGSIVVAGSDAAGTTAAVVVRLQASGVLDPTFGRGGTTLIDLETQGSNPVVNKLLLGADGDVIAAGGDNWSGHPFVVRLLGTGGAGVPGVLGASQPSPSTNEQSPEAIVKVRRTGGSAGAVSVAYQTQAVAPDVATPATAGADYSDVSGRLNWSDGDTSEQEIHVPIKADTVTEGPETFQVKLSDPQGGAGLGTTIANVEIGADGSPYGQFSVWDTSANEGSQVPVTVSRDYYSTGAVSVTLTPTAGTASAGTDFDATPVTVSWADGDSAPKTVMINIPDDTEQEGDETFTVTLSNPTGGALIGPTSKATVTISANDAPAPPPASGSGGGTGSMGFVSLLLLGTAGFLRSLMPRKRRAGR